MEKWNSDKQSICVTFSITFNNKIIPAFVTSNLFHDLLVSFFLCLLVYLTYVCIHGLWIVDSEKYFMILLLYFLLSMRSNRSITESQKAAIKRMLTFIAYKAFICLIDHCQLCFMYRFSSLVYSIV